MHWGDPEGSGGEGGGRGDRDGEYILPVFKLHTELSILCILIPTSFVQYSDFVICPYLLNVGIFYNFMTV